MFDRDRFHLGTSPQQGYRAPTISRVDVHKLSSESENVLSATDRTL